MKGTIIMKEFSLKELEMNDVLALYEPFELELILLTEPNTSDVDIMLENMLHFFIEKEEYSYCVVVRDEQLRRK
jgi:hypothetical protein